MATSGTSTFNLTRDRIIRAAGRKIGAWEAGDTPAAKAVDDFAEALNSMVKRWAASGIHVWTVEEATLFLQLGQTSYSLGSGSTDHATQSYTATTLSSAAVAGASTIAVTSATGFASTYYVGVVLDSGALDWTTVSGAPSGTTITLAATLDGAAAAGNAVYVYQTKIARPLKVVDSRRYAFDGAQDSHLTMLSRLDYQAMSDKTSRGTVNQLFYDPRGGANALGKLHVWPAPSDATSAVNFTWYRPIQDFNVASDEPDLPNEWIDTLIFNLALAMAPEYDVPTAKFVQIKTFATEYLDELRGWDREPESIIFGADLDRW